MDIYITSSLIIGFLLVVYYYLAQKLKYWEKRKIPTATTKYVPFFGHLWPLITCQKSLGNIYEDCYNSAPNSSMVGVYNFGTPELLLRDPELIKTVLQTNFVSFGRTMDFIDHDKEPLLSKNPFFNEGEEWKKQRSILTNTMSTAKLKNMAMGMNEVYVKLDTYLQEKIKLNAGFYEVKGEDLFGRFTSEVVAKVGFGIDGNSFTDNPGNFFELVKKVFEPTGLKAFKQLIAFFFPPLGKIVDVRFIPTELDKYLRSVVREILDVRKKSGIRGNDFIQQINDVFESDSQEFDELSVTAYAVSFMIDGYLTTSFTLSVIALELAVYPEIQEKLRKEIKDVLKHHENKITYETIQDMKYMDLVIHESMRFRSVLSTFTRVCTEEFKLAGNDGLECVVQPNSKIVVCPVGLHTDPKYWENPQIFNPDRFKDGNNNFNKYVFFPFGVGPRICPGQRMAMLQMKGALTKLLDNYSLELSSKMKLPIVDDVTSMLNTAKGGTWLKIKPLYKESKMELLKLFLCAITVIIIYLVIYLYKQKIPCLDKRIPCVSGVLPLIGHNLPIIIMKESFIIMFYKFYNQLPDSSIISYYNFRTPGIIIRDPELVKTIMLSGFDKFSKNTSTLDANLDPLLATNPFFVDGDEWKTNRTILLHGLSSRKLKLMALQIRDVSAKFTAYLKSETNGQDTISVNSIELLSRFTAEVVAIAAFGIDGKSFTKEPRTFETMIRPMLKPGSSKEFIHILTFFFPILAKLFKIRFMPKEINDYFCFIVESVLESRKKSLKYTDDFLHQVSEMCRTSLTDVVDTHAVTSHAASVYLDGYITSSIALILSAYQIAAHPEVQDKVRQEVREVFKKYPDGISYEMLQDMKYLEQVINESLRIFPPLGYLGKVCTEEFKLVGNDGLECVVYPGTEVIIPVMALHHDSKFWENPDEFDPDRFSEEKKNNHHKYVHLPFGTGPRICVGRRLALMQIKAALATLIRDYAIDVHPKTDEPIRVHPLSGLFTSPHCEIWLRIKPLSKE
ncbi:uncharacterized protein [Chelonus insularis]|uniref:uncharacterized protein n=1 Tax=Chelonus insularis TaxID=460826 RepID=UPI00158AC1D8|nr:uncharacterized protein LOC118066278 [Chelonus insularis]